jgi:hypothetical protein
MTDVLALIKTSTTPEEWADNLRKIREANGGTYPDFWYDAVVFSGLLDRIIMKWDLEGPPASAFKRREPIESMGPAKTWKGGSDRQSKGQDPRRGGR